LFEDLISRASQCDQGVIWSYGVTLLVGFILLLEVGIVSAYNQEYRKRTHELAEFDNLNL